MSSSVRVWRLGSGAAAILFSTLGRCVTFVSPTNERNQTTKKKNNAKATEGRTLNRKGRKKKTKDGTFFSAARAVERVQTDRRFKFWKIKTKKKERKENGGSLSAFGGGGVKARNFGLFFGVFWFFCARRVQRVQDVEVWSLLKRKENQMKMKEKRRQLQFLFLRRHEMRLPMRVALFGYVDCSRRN